MPKENFYSLLTDQLHRLDKAKTAKRHELSIERFQNGRAFINDKEYIVFNSNDYLGLRFHPAVIQADHVNSTKYGAGPGAVRFISGTLQIYKDLEKSLATFHQRDDAIIFSSAFAANVSVLSCLINPPDLQNSTLVLSDELNHRSIIDGIRLANIPKEHKAIYRHLGYEHIEQLLLENKGTFDRVLIITDGIFSMLGEATDIYELQRLTQTYDPEYKHGVWLIVDDSHGVGVFGPAGRGCEDYFNAQADILVGTMGKAFGADGGYVVGAQIVINYLRETAATYVYSNSISPGTAGAAHQAITILMSSDGSTIRQKLQENINLFKELMTQTKFTVVNSKHPIQPILIGDPHKTKTVTEALFNAGYLVTGISYPVVPEGKDEIRVQLSASHQEEDIKKFVHVLSELT